LVVQRTLKQTGLNTCHNHVIAEGGPWGVDTGHRHRPPHKKSCRLSAC